ncbi:Uncharacterized protein FKW44_013140 [Caligus rogercresseyi]|uniref:Uncharacterized protein n=1 Tax=Caligus rogercresseyi TaxID=217165 RepID=A0A7T8HKF6_CALRO|nr:Uncharacterized protein FKW44_013140 [Caligus rogercresseyi]
MLQSAAECISAWRTRGSFFFLGGIMVQDYYLNHLQEEGGTSPAHYSITAIVVVSSRCPTTTIYSRTMTGTTSYPPRPMSMTTASLLSSEEQGRRRELLSEMLPQSKDPLINKSVESMDADWESLISEAVKDSENKSLDLLEMALQESKATELEEDPSHFPIEPVQFTFDPLSFALSQEPLGATLDKNRTALAMKNASHMLRGSSQQLNRNINHNNVNHSRLARPMRNVVIPPPSPSYLTGAAPKTSVIKVSKGNVILQIPSSISSASQKTSNPRSLLMPKKPVSALSQPRMVKILDPKTKPLN